MSGKIKFTKQYNPMGFGDRDDRGSVEAKVQRTHERAGGRRRTEARRYLHQSGTFLYFKTRDTVMDNKALLALWNLEDMPACPEGMMLAQAFLISCGEGVNKLGTEEPSDRITDITACYMALVEHGEGCDNCNEVCK